MASNEPKKTKKEEKGKVEEKVEENELENQEEGEQGATALFDQPLVLEGKRKRKSVEMFAYSTKGTPMTNPEYQGGDGEKLGDIAFVQHNITKTRSDDLKFIHKICYGSNISNSAALKKNLRQFSGWNFSDDNEEYKRKKAQLERSSLANITFTCNFMGLEASDDKDDMIQQILKFVTKPYNTGKLPPTPKKRKSSSHEKGEKKQKLKDGEGEEENEEEKEGEEKDKTDTNTKNTKQDEKEVNETNGKEDETEEKKEQKEVEEKETPTKQDDAMETENEAQPTTTDDNKEENKTSTDTKVENNTNEAPPLITSTEGGAKEE